MRFERACRMHLRTARVSSFAIAAMSAGVPTIARARRSIANCWKGPAPSHHDQDLVGALDEADERVASSNHVARTFSSGRLLTGQRRTRLPRVYHEVVRGWSS